MILLKHKIAIIPIVNYPPLRSIDLEAGLEKKQLYTERKYIMTEIKKCEFCGRSEMETAMGFNNGKGICLNCALMIANRFEVFSKTKGHEGLSQQIELFYQENPSPYKMNYSGHAHATATHHGFVRTKPKEMKLSSGVGI